jgi:hypothetical protein
MDWETLWKTLEEFQTPQHRPYWPYLLTATFIALIIFMIGRRHESLGWSFLGLDSESRRMSVVNDGLFFLANYFVYRATIYGILMSGSIIRDLPDGCS